MSSEAETSRDATGRYRNGILPLRCASLRMTTFRGRIVFAIVCAASAALAQESTSPTPSPTLGESPYPSISPEQSVPPSPSPEQTLSPSPARSVRISFVPPPMDGTISLGIYDQAGKLVRVLHQNAQLSDFTIGPDSLVTRWDGKDDGHQDLPSGRYRARGYLVGPLKREDRGGASLSPTEPAANTVKIRLVRNPLRKDKKPMIELGVGFDSEGSCLKASDGLPLFKISETPSVTRAGIAAKGENTVDVWQDDGTSVHQFRISNVDQIMAFDCGELELK
jgi:hypothetical protein